ncbi:MAG: hypothetical protein AAF495_00425 [Pseudomonadota bacterium]
MNIQAGNVGNRGDILKHGALVQLALALKASAASGSYYVDTHAYLLQAPPTNLERWHCDVSELCRSFAAYRTYREIEQCYLDQVVYRCSAGLALDLLCPTHTYLA